MTFDLIEYSSADGVVFHAVTQAPLVRDVLAANASRIDEVSYPWWS